MTPTITGLKSLNEQLNKLGFRHLSKYEAEYLKQRDDGVLARLINVTIKAAHTRDDEAMATVQKALSWIASSVSQAEGAPPAAPAPAQAQQAAPQARSAGHGQGGPAQADNRPRPAQAPAQARPAQPNTAPASDGQGRSREDIASEVETFVSGESIIQIKVFGGRGAIQYEMSRLRDNRRGGLVLMIEAAKGANKVYDWGNKIVMRCTPEELVRLVAVLHGIIPSCRFDNHGPANDKGYEIEDQGKHFYAKVWTGEKGSLVGVPMPREWGTTLALLCMGLLQRLYPGQSTHDILTTISRTLPQR